MNAHTFFQQWSAAAKAWGSNRVIISETLVDHALDRVCHYRSDVPPRRHSGGSTSPA
jgi:hypothetical protein